MKATPCCIPDLPCDVLQMTVDSSFDPFRSSREGGKRQTQQEPLCVHFC